jgi:nitroreductase
MAHVKHATTDHPVQPAIARRWSPYGFGEGAVSGDDLASLFEAARWAPSSYNEQPWVYLVARREDAEDFERAVSCLVEGNRAWASRAAVLVLAVVRTTYARNGKPNRVALHDLGLASANLSVEATARNLSVHQMGGILPDRIRELYALPADVEPATALAIGVPDDADALPEPWRERDGRPRSRKPLAEFVFAGAWGKPADLADR